MTIDHSGHMSKGCRNPVVYNYEINNPSVGIVRLYEGRVCIEGHIRLASGSCLSVLSRGDRAASGKLRHQWIKWTSILTT